MNSPKRAALVLLIAGVAIIAMINMMLRVPANPGGGTTNGSRSSAAVSSTGTNARIEAKLGEFCGGIAGILCADGLTCQYEGTYPDAGGTCVEE